MSLSRNRIKVDWNDQVNNIPADSISVIQIEDDIKHSFSKFIFQMKVKKKLKFYFYACIFKIKNKIQEQQNM